MFSKRDLKSFLAEISPEAKFMKFEFTSSENFTIVLKCKTETDQNVDFYSRYSGEWIAKFSKFTSTAWIVRHSFSKLKRLLFRKIFVCHRSSHNKKKERDVEGRNQGCRARIEFRAKFINKNTIRNDPQLKEGLNMTVTIEFAHTHKVKAPESLNLLSSNSETDKIIEEYYNMGCTSTAAKYYHELSLIDKYGEDCVEILSNATLNPTLRHILYVYDKRKKSGTESVDNLTLLSQKKECLESKGCLVTLEDDRYINVITPLMKALCQEFDTNNTIIIDSTNISNETTVTFYLIPTKLGALPIASSIHKPTVDYSELYNSIKYAISSATEMKFQPAVAMVDNLANYRNVSIQDKTVKLFTSHYSLCSEIWRWLNTDDNKIERKKRHQILIMIKELLLCESTDVAEKHYLQIQGHEYVTITSKLKEYIDNLWVRRPEWMTGDNTSKLVETSIRINKEFFRKRCKGFNEVILVDVITKIFENHQRRILASYAKEHNVNRAYAKYLPKNKDVLEFGAKLRRIGTKEFRLDCGQKPKKHFRIDTLLCDCLSGKKGHFCDHLTAIIIINAKNIITPPKLSQEEKEQLIKLAGDIEDETSEVKSENVDENFEEFDNDDEKQDVEFDNNEEQHSDDDEVSMKSDNYFYLDVKAEKCDPLEDPTSADPTATEITRMVTEEQSNESWHQAATPSSGQSSKQLKINKYKTALKALNDEFRRLNRLFSENPNRSNLETMNRLSRELSKIRAVDRVNLDGLGVRMNSRCERKSQNK